MSNIIRGRTNQKGCFVCGKPIQKMGQNALILKDSDGNIAFCSWDCADKFNPETAKSMKKKSNSKKKIDSLLMVAAKPLKVMDDTPRGIEKPVKIKKSKKSREKPSASDIKMPAEQSKTKQTSGKPKASIPKKTSTKKPTSKKAPVKKASTSGKPVKKAPTKKAAPSKSTRPKK